MMELEGTSLGAVEVKRVLLSVSDKTGLIEFARHLHDMGCTLVGTTSTQREISSAGLPCLSVDEVTQFPEILGGRVKTLHPAIFGGILARANVSQDGAELANHRIEPFDLVVCNLYPFQQAAARATQIQELIENIDIGGVSLLRAAAKNHARVAVVCDPSDYTSVLREMASTRGTLSGETRISLAIKALEETACYDSVIGQTLRTLRTVKVSGQSQFGPGPIAVHAARKESEYSERIDALPADWKLHLKRVQSLRYGENPHQKASFYSLHDTEREAVVSLDQLTCFHGKELSYNNMLDIEHGVRLIHEFPRITAQMPSSTGSTQSPWVAAILKHNVPCGVGQSANSLAEAYERAFAGDPVSPFGGIVIANGPVDVALATKLQETFLEVVVAPDFDPAALDILQRKKNLRLCRLPLDRPLANRVVMTHVQGGLLIQSADDKLWDLESLVHPTDLKPTHEDLRALEFAFRIVKHVRSNAIVMTNSVQTLGVAGGFTNRVDAVAHCLRQARLSLSGAVLASDAFFPFPDSVELLKGTGIRHIVQPGGSVKDAEVIAACNRLGLGMTFTGVRHFKH